MNELIMLGAGSAFGATAYALASMALRIEEAKKTKVLKKARCSTCSLIEHGKFNCVKCQEAKDNHSLNHGKNYAYEQMREFGILHNEWLRMDSLPTRG